jgi:hypothetical protein
LGTAQSSSDLLMVEFDRNPFFSAFSVQYWLALPMQGKKAFCCFIQLGAAL